MQHADAFDHVELSSQAPQREDVGLAMRDLQAQFLRLAPGIAQAGQAEINRQHVLVAETLRHGDGALASAASGDQDILQQTPGLFEALGKFGV